MSGITTSHSRLMPTKQQRKAPVFAVSALALCISLSACTTPDATSDTKPTGSKPLEIVTTNGDVGTSQDRAREDLSSVEEVIVTASKQNQPAPGRPESEYADQSLHGIAKIARMQSGAEAHWIRPPIAPHPGFQPRPQDNERYPGFDENPVKLVSEVPVSTFSIDVDSASYANVRRMLNAGQMPNAEAVRIEELINYFSYGYQQPKASDNAFTVATEIGPSPWHPERKLLHIGIQGVDIDRSELPPSNLVFLIDVSGSMQSANKLALLKPAMKMLVRQLREQDSIAIAVYAGAAGTVLEPTAGNEKAKIMAAIDNLRAGGSTNGAAGIELAYDLARSANKEGGINRVLLATDGDFNVGTVSVDALKALVEKERKSGVSLSVLGFGGGNYNDAIMQELAQNGNGNAAYIDTLNEARKVLVEEMSSTLKTIAKDVKIQVEFNPATVSEYRLIGYETRHLEREDFNNDKVDAGEIGAGHSVTALYEVTLAGSQGSIDPLRYARTAPQNERSSSADELAFVRLRYKAPGGDTSSLQEFAISKADVADDLAKLSAAYRFSAAVAGFGQLLRGSKYTQDFDFDDVASLAQSAKSDDSFGYRSEFVNLVRTAALLGDVN
ncbi:MAG: VWA domain-containing protein [Pseudomonadaceae bacterium]|nr:VWA domain-containing protein [Pseudomonadaceae bacterium]